MHTHTPTPTPLPPFNFWLVNCNSSSLWPHCRSLSTATLLWVAGLNFERQLAKPHDSSHTLLKRGSVPTCTVEKSVDSLFANPQLEKPYQPEPFSSLFCTRTGPVRIYIRLWCYALKTRLDYCLLIWQIFSLPLKKKNNICAQQKHCWVEVSKY